MEPLFKFRSTRGQGAVEYAFILVFVIAIVVIGLKTGAFSYASQHVQNYLNTTVNSAVSK